VYQRRRGRRLARAHRRCGRRRRRIESRRGARGGPPNDAVRRGTREHQRRERQRRHAQPLARALLRTASVVRSDLGYEFVRALCQKRPHRGFRIESDLCRIGAHERACEDATR
jgi:hypothetical protein